MLNQNSPISNDGYMSHFIRVDKYLSKLGLQQQPYHNYRHMFGVYELAIQMTLRNDNHRHDNDIKTKLVYACLFHDIEHSGGREPDSENIKRAVAHFRHFIDMFNIKFNNHDATVKEIVEAIECTEYPYRIEPKNDLERYLRDADALQATYSGDVSVIMEDLRAEMMIAQSRGISYEEMLGLQVKYFNNLVVYTNAAKQFVKMNKDKYIEALTKYIDLQQQSEE